jgi:O-antigen/teichoic acid export membrane protein
MIASRIVALGVMAFGFAVLGRILPPVAFGHFALAVAVYGLAETCVQFGLRQYVIRSEDELSRRTIQSAAGLSLVIAGGLCCLILGLAAILRGSLVPGPVATALVPLSLALLIGPFVLGTEALLQRSLRFGLISVVEVVRVAVDVAVAISLALLGFGAAALACGMLAAQATVAVLLLLLGGRENRAWPRFGGWRHFRVWGGRLTLIQIMPKVGDLAMYSALSSLQGPQVLGLFNRGRAIQQILDRALFEGIRPVILPVLSDALRSGVPAARLYQAKLEYLTAVCWPGFALIALMAEPLVAVLLGSQWEAVVPTVRILALMGLALPVTKMSQKLFIALDATETYLWLQTVQGVVRLPLAIAGAMVSLEAFALAYVAGTWVKALGIAWHLHRRLGHQRGAHRRTALRSGAITLATLAGPALVLAADLAPTPTLLAGLALAILGWLAAAIVLDHPAIGEIRNAALDLRTAISRRPRRS